MPVLWNVTFSKGTLILEPRSVVCIKKDKDSKKSATKITHNESARNVAQVFARLRMKSLKSGWHPAQLEPAHNGKITLRSPSSNAMSFPFFAGKIIVISLW